MGSGSGGFTQQDLRMVGGGTCSHLTRSSTGAPFLFFGLSLQLLDSLLLKGHQVYIPVGHLHIQLL